MTLNMSSVTSEQILLSHKTLQWPHAVLVYRLPIGKTTPAVVTKGKLQPVQHNYPTGLPECIFFPTGTPVKEGRKFSDST